MATTTGTATPTATGTLIAVSTGTATATAAATPGRVEIDKVFCPSADGTRTEFEVFPPQDSEPLAGASLVATCETREGVAFTIKDSHGEIVATVTTGPGGIVQFELPPGAYTLSEDATGATTTFRVETGKLTAIFVRNFESGEVKLLKFFCASGDSGTVISVDGAPQPQAQNECHPGNAQFQIDGEPVFAVGSAGIRLFPLAPGAHTITEVVTGATANFTVTTGNITTIVVYNFPSPTPTATLAPASWIPVPNGAGSTVVEIVFADPLKRETVENALTLVDATGAAVAGETYLLVDFDSQELVGIGFRPTSLRNGTFTATLKGGAGGVQTNDGRTMGGDYQWSFTLTTLHTIFIPLVSR